jgi:acetyl esterase
MPVYDPNARYEVKKFEVEYRHDGDTSWPAAVYQPQGDGPFPALLHIHGGAWNTGNPVSSDIVHTALAATGLVVVGIQLRTAPEHTHPAQILDTNYGARWLKAHAAYFNATPEHLGMTTSSSGGQPAMISAMRPTDPQYATLPLPEAPDNDASVAYVIAMWPVLDPYFRYLYAKGVGKERVASNTEAYFLTEEVMEKHNPQYILDQGNTTHLPPLLVLQGDTDENIPNEIPQNFEKSYQAAGGHIELEWFPGMPHQFLWHEGPATDRGIELAKGFVARQLATSDIPSS